MLKKKAIRKIFITTLTAFVLLVVYSIPSLYEEDAIKTNLEIEYITGIGTNDIYLLDQNGYLVKTKILLDSTDKQEQIKQLINNLIIGDNSKFPNGLTATIPSGTKLLEVFYDENYVTLNFNNNLLKDKDNLESIIESIVYSIIDLGDVNGVIIEVNGETIDGYSKVLDKKIGINKKYHIKSRNNINKVVIYYMEEIDGNKYYVPVTKYVNDEDDKIEIIVDELTTSYIYEPNLMSFLNSNTELLNYKEQENIMTLNFNNAIFDEDNKILEEVTYTLAYSIFDNYDVNQVLIQVDGKNIEDISLEDIK
ncbi:MAG: GerMN domain-containing protein [Bacilli bacterium]|nr:GerMN domain-containing protein [Bacilli bacterium]